MSGLFKHSFWFLLATLLYLNGQPLFAAVFGQDNRQKTTFNSPLYPLARATAVALLKSGYSQHQTGTISLSTDLLTQFCKDELFYNEPSIPYACTGFLVAPDLLVTAGHCMYAINTPNQELKDESGLACEAFDWIFDYATQPDGTVNLEKIPAENLYHCKRIVYAVHKDKSPFQDFALIQLDRTVTGRNPLKLSSTNPALGSEHFMIGHPFGTPQKISDHGRVLLNNPAHSAFVTNLDASEGNSGSPVFNSKKEVVGILVSGTPSANTYYDSKNKCERVNRCNDQGKNCALPDKDTSLFPGFQIVGSDVQRINPLISLIQNIQPVQPPKK